MINTITITGRVTAKPDVKSVKVSKKEKKSVARVTIAVNKNEDTAFFFPVVAWGPMAKALEKYVNKGDKITIFGYLTYDEWENDDGERRSKIYITAQSVEFMTKAKKGEKGKNKSTKLAKSKRDEDDDEDDNEDDEEEDLPF